MLALSGSALAQQPVPPAPAQAKLTVSWQQVSHDRGAAVALRGDAVRIAGTLTPFVAGQTVKVRVYRGKRKLLAKAVKVRAAGGHGRFRLAYRASETGSIRVEAVHRATPELATVRATRKRLQILTPRAGAGARGPVVRLLQRGLTSLRYAVPLTGVLDGGTQRAIMAWRKVNGRARTFEADEFVIRAVLAGRGAFKPRQRTGRHAEADLSRQVLALVGDGGKVERTYHISSGAPVSPTVMGNFRVYLKTPGTNAKGMVHSSYFHGAYAIHGYISVPPFNASHGCLRVPIPNAASIFAWLKYGTPVSVYR